MNKVIFSIVFGLLFFALACTKENSVTIVETVEPIELGFRMTVNGTDIETDAVAAYCQNDTMEFIMIANKQANLSFPLETQNFEAGDFVYFTSISDNVTWAYGGQALGEDVTGMEGFLSILFSDATITIESNNGELVTGSSEGILIGIPQGGTFSQYPYAMNFAAEIIQESDFCD